MAFNRARGRRAVAFAASCAILASGVVHGEEERRSKSPTAQPSEATPVDAAADEVFAIGGVLERSQLIGEALRRNPSVEAARAGWRAAQARVPQQRALEDPMLSYNIAPLSAFEQDARFGQSIQLQQRFPFPGKRQLRGEVAEADAAIAREGWEQTRLRIATTASLLYDDWYLVHRSIEINAGHIALMEALKKAAEAQYVVGRASQQDPLQAEVELSHLLHDKFVLQAQREVVQAEINGLLHRPPERALPEPVKVLEVRKVPPGTSEELQSIALKHRPELRSSQARIEGRRAATELAQRSYYPDFGVMASYNSMWMQTPHQFMVGVSVNIPIYLGKRRAAVDETQASALRATLEQKALEDDIRVEVETARQRLIEAMHVVHLHRTRLIPAARDQVAAARAGFETGRNSFLAVIEAEKNLRSVELRVEGALAAVQRREAELQRALGDVSALREQGVQK